MALGETLVTELTTSRQKCVGISEREASRRARQAELEGFLSFSWVWYHWPRVPARAKWRQEDQTFRIVFSYVTNTKRVLTT